MLDQYVKDCLACYDRINERQLLSPQERILVTSLHSGPDPSVITSLKAELRKLRSESETQGAREYGPAERSRVALELQEKQFKNASASAVHVAERIALLNAGKICAEEAIRVGLQRTGGMSAVKLASKGVGVATWKGASKFVPIVGPLVAGSCFAVYRLVGGEYAKAVAELASGVVGSVPGTGTAASLAIDAGIAGWDVYDAYYEGKVGCFDVEAHVRLAELLLQIEMSVRGGDFSFECFVDCVFEQIDAKMKVSTDDVFVAHYIHGIYADFFTHESSIDKSRVISKMNQMGYKQDVCHSVHELMKQSN